MELRREGLEIRVLGELSLALEEVSLCFGLEVHLGRAERVVLGDEVVLIHSF